MKVAFIIRSTWQSVPGGDAMQAKQTAMRLKDHGISVDIFPSNSPINYSQYDLLHFFNLQRPADILPHIEATKKPFVVTPIMVDYSEYDRHHRIGISGMILKRVSSGEYIKTLGRWISGRDKYPGKKYLVQGHDKSILNILKQAAKVLPNSPGEETAMRKRFGVLPPSNIVPNGIDASLFKASGSIQKNDKLVLCAARIEGLKNQLSLIRALNGTEFTLLLIGAAAPAHQSYYKQCVKEAGPNVQFIQHLPQQDLIGYYQQAKVHVLPSWFETCGLSSLEAAAMYCNIVIAEKGFTRDYFGDDAFYCEPSKPASILEAIRAAAQSEANITLANRINEQYTWEQAAKITAAAYKEILC